MSVKYRIELGNCEPGINDSISRPVVVPQDVTFDSTEIRFDSTIITFDNI